MTNLISLSLYSFNSFVFKTFITVCFFFIGCRRASATSRTFRSAFFYFPLFLQSFFSSFLFPTSSLCFKHTAINFTLRSPVYLPIIFLQLLEQLFLCKVLHEYKSQIKENVANIISYFYCPTIISHFPFHFFFVCLHILVLRHKFSDCISFTF